MSEHARGPAGSLKHSPIALIAASMEASSPYHAKEDHKVLAMNWQQQKERSQNL